jgi:hypothetical protein
LPGKSPAESSKAKDITIFAAVGTTRYEAAIEELSGLLQYMAIAPHLEWYYGDNFD